MKSTKTGPGGAVDPPVIDYHRELGIRKITQILSTHADNDYVFAFLDRMRYRFNLEVLSVPKDREEQNDLDKLVEIIRDLDEAFIISLLNQFRLIEQRKQKQTIQSMFPRIAATV